MVDPRIAVGMLSHLMPRHQPFRHIHPDFAKEKRKFEKRDKKFKYPLFSFCFIHNGLSNSFTTHGRYVSLISTP